MTDIIVYKQIYPAQCPKLATLGIKSLVNLCFDGESAEQPSTLTLAKSASDAGLAYAHLPYDDALPAKMVHEFSTLAKQLPKPLLLFCKSGGRAKRLYQSATILGLLD